MLLGSRGSSAPGSPASAWSASPKPSSTVIGRRTSRDRKRPARLPATAVPRCGAAMKIARSTPGNGAKPSTGCSRDRARASRSGSGSRSARTASHSRSPAEETISREITPPMLWPISTMSREAGISRKGSTRSSASDTVRRMAAWLSAIGALVG